jgi:Protein of unknown function (DUF3149)
MKAIVDLFSTDYGLMSLAVILFIFVIAAYMKRFISRKMEESEREQARLAAHSRSPS